MAILRSLFQLHSPLNLARLLWVVAQAFLAILVFSGCESNQPVGNLNRGNSRNSVAERSEAKILRPFGAGYVGSDACQKCHSSISEAFHHHPMSKSLDDPKFVSEIEDFKNASFTPQTGLTYYVTRTDDGVFHHEKRVDAEGEVIYDQGIKIGFAVGSGIRGRSFLINDSGRMYVSPISWFTQEQKWMFSPGYTPESNLRFDRRASDGCLSCHAGLTIPQGQDINRFAENPFPERSIGCERCHGPGADHIKFRSEVIAAASADPIFNPAKVNDARRDAVCNQCHLQGKRRVVLSGRTEFDFRPGMYLSENWIVFLKTASVQTNENAAAVSQVEQMYSSHCYSKSDGQLGCISCHSGHEPPSGNGIGHFFNERCIKCHSNSAVMCSESVERRHAIVEKDSCIACHMPKFPATDVHASQTDHRIHRRPEKLLVEPKKPERFRDTKLVRFEEPGVRVPRFEADRARGIFRALQVVGGAGPEYTKEAIETLRSSIRRFSDDVEARYMLAQTLEAAGKSFEASEEFLQVLNLQPTHEEALEAIATLNHKNRNLHAARSYYERLIEVNPQRPTYYGRLAHVLGQLDELPRGIKVAEKCLELNPSLIQTHVWLVEAYNRVGNTELASQHEAIVKRFQSLKNSNSQNAAPQPDK